MPNASDIRLLYHPVTPVMAKIVELDPILADKLRDSWWTHPDLDAGLLDGEIDRAWDWQDATVQFPGLDGPILPSLKLAVVTEFDGRRPIRRRTQAGMPAS